MQLITKHHILLLSFTITIQKPTEICQVSCKNQSRISARVSDDTSSLARVSNDLINPARVSDDTSSPTRISDDIRGPIRLWHVSLIRLCHVSFIHPQTPINRSLPKTFKGAKIQKWKSSVRIKPQSLQELQPQNRRTFEAESSKPSA